ncbi:enoyl-CoA hydratase/isomerase family protein [Marinospirillum alkaliphilum]|uniref:Enoyl-CoA hydratase n=1 Tax=Marinospirillum alkaliphilum DSM 21637 TaxID=1122209 RepID=A0A1K1UDI5_9GAMM|nr:enoyl-CoA hydratase/isomerase family protein [Marinospirillum alkaliphilum]SFX10872.1 enoyl-CoA hydratase [Marinospirillum alkaliphilum DSM 21637]
MSSDVDLQPVLSELKDGVLWITLNRPQRLNAVSKPLYDRLCELLDEAERSAEVRVVVLTGAGRAFCVGADMKAHGEGTRTAFERREYLRGEQEVCRRLFELSRPVVAAVNGYALGAGAEMALAADFLLMKADAQWGLPETGIGAFIGGGVSWLLPARVGLGKARELVMLGERLDGRQALAMGLAHRCLDAADTADFQQQVQAFALQLASKAPLSMALAKQHLNRAAQRGFEDALVAELEGMMFCSTTRDWQEGVDAFAEKRQPVFTGQ